MLRTPNRNVSISPVSSVAHRQHHAWFGDAPSSGRILADHGIGEQVLNLRMRAVGAVTARQARIRQIQDLLTNAVVGEDPPDDGIAEPGMVLTVRYDDTGEIETFLLGVRGVEDADIDVYSMQSPLGSAIVGARPGEQRTYSIPSGANLPVTLLKAVPYGMHAPKSPRRQSVPPRRTSDPRRPVATRTGSDPTPKRTATTSRRARSST